MIADFAIDVRSATRLPPTLSHKGKFNDRTPLTMVMVAELAIRHGSGQSVKVEALHWRCWNGDHCDPIADLDANLTTAVVAMIVPHAHLAGDADDLLRKNHSEIR